jgi:hypothetical protein
MAVKVGRGAEMSPWQLLIWLVVAVGFGFAGWGVGNGKGRPALGAWLGFLLGLIGIIIIACIPKTEAAKQAEAQRRYQVQGPGAWPGGYPYGSQQPYAPGPYAPYPPPAQDPYAHQQPAGQWPQQPPPDQWGQQQPPDQWPQQPPPPDPWPGPQQLAGASPRLGAVKSG